VTVFAFDSDWVLSIVFFFMQVTVCDVRVSNSDPPFLFKAKVIF